MRSLRALAAVALLLCSAACGVKSDPVPPLSDKAEAKSDSTESPQTNIRKKKKEE